MTDTIYALSTSQGRAGIAVVRISGPDAFLSLKSMSKDIQIKPRKTHPPKRICKKRKVLKKEKKRTNLKRAVNSKTLGISFDI